MNLPLESLSKFCRTYNIKLMVLFGSYNTEMFQMDSDIDIAVITDNINLLKSKKVVILSELSSLFNHTDIDLVILNHADPLLKFMVATEGTLIYEYEKGFFEVFKVRAMSEHNDARKFYKLDKMYIEKFIKEGINGKKGINPPQIKQTN